LDITIKRTQQVAIAFKAVIHISIINILCIKLSVSRDLCHILGVHKNLSPLYPSELIKPKRSKQQLLAYILLGWFSKIITVHLNQSKSQESGRTNHYKILDTAKMAIFKI